MNTPTDPDDDQSGMMGWWIGDALDTPFFLKTRMAFAVVIGLAATMLFTYIILQMERQTTTYNAALMEAAVGERDTQLELEEDTQSTMTNGTAHQSNSDYVQASDDNDNDDDMSIHSNATSNTARNVMASISNKADGLFKPGDNRRRLLSTPQIVQVMIHVMIVLLFIFLLLVYLPGSIWLSFVAVMIVWVLALQSYLRDELKRRQRVDRITTLLGLFSIIAGSFCLITYCHLALKEGSIYEGPARIVGYDDSTYSNTDGDTMRADLIVSWGGMWGCPDLDGKQCTATVQGALCETEYDTTDLVADGNYRRRRRSRHSRRLEDVVQEVEEYQEEKERRVPSSPPSGDYSIVAALEDETVEEGEEIEELSEELDTETEIHIEGEDALEAEVTVLEANSTDSETETELTDLALDEAYEAGATEGEVEELENENQKLQSELDEDQELIDMLDEEVVEVEDEIFYSYDDNIYEDSYWQETDWDSVWGEYACEDLFNGDTSGMEENLDEAPGSDHWPTVNIYGSCNSCKAYILDYYSTEHYQNIRQFENQSYLYYLAGFFFMVGAAILAMFERKRPNKENKIVLLSQERGVVA